ncbi:uncharacterized protein LOC143021873 isoform X4 [Oratosquilla oratoria]|uniref:uncharacterized protein LOC143021873 isoform X4 n=1 Tax=Oratosquilla oratoria TaxID=337810 RepID=UPI003F7679BB
MVRKYQSKTDRARADGNLMERAVDEVVKGKSIREVSRLLDVNRITLSRYVKKFQAGQAKKTKDYAPKYNTRQVFTEEEEDGLAEYIVTCSQLLHGLGLTAVRRLAFDYAMKKDKTCPDSWKHNCMAGKDWMAGFMKRHCKITLHLPESTSVASVQAFNKQSVGEFFDIWTKTQAEKMFGPESVYNLDETGITTVQNVPKILATREQKQIGQTAAAERGTLITVCCCVNAVGRSLPPAMIFPRVHFKDFMTKGSPTGTLGLATQSEWMNSDLFPLVLQHFIKHMGCSTEKPAVLFMDNHESHLSLEVMEMARKHGLSIITFPPHTSHKLQPLDVSVYGPLKTHYKQAVNDWNLSSPGKRITIYDLPECFTKAYHRALSVENILAGFKKTGIWPIDTQIFSDNDFLAASVFMSRPNIDNVVNNGGDVVNPQGDLNLPSTSTASTMSTNKDSCQEEGLDHQTSFEEWTDLRKPSNQSSNQASKRKIAGAKKITSTPEKNLALMKMEEKLQKLRKTQKRLVVEDESSDEEVENTSIHGESSEYEEDFAADQTEEQSMKEECDSDNNDSSTIANENDLAGLMKEEENFEEELTIKEEPLDDREIDIRTIRKRKKRKLNSSIGRSEPKQKFVRTTLDIDRFISELEDRPAIWDVRCKEYNHKTAKTKAWEEMCDIFVSGFGEMDSVGKNNAVRDIQRKWKSLRDCFRRELATIKKEKSGSAQESGRKEYMYFKQLSFLLPICKTSSHENESAEDPTEGRNTEEESQLLNPSNHDQKTKKPPPSDEQVLFQALAKKVNGADDPEKQFLLSLLPDLRSIPERAKLDVKIEFMNVLKRYKQHSTLANQQYFPPPHNFLTGPSSSASHEQHNFLPSAIPSQATETHSQPVSPHTPSPEPSSQTLSPWSDNSSICDEYYNE